MLKRPQWVKEKIEGKEKEVPIQMTVKKKYTMQPQYANMPTMGMGMGMTTGSGVDGTVQPGKMVDVQVHEGEGIIPNNAMQGITGEEFQELIGSLSSGDIDKNKLREAIGMPTISEYQTGGTIDPSKRRGTGVPDSRVADEVPAEVPDKAYVRDPWARRTYDVSKFIGNAGTIKAPEAPTRQTVPETVTPPIKVQPIEQQQTLAPPQEFTREKVAEAPPVVAPPPVQQTVSTEEVKAETPATTTTETKTTPETVTQPVTSPAGEMVRTGLQKILAETEGVTETDQKIIDYYLQNTDASNAANMRKLEAQISADPYMSDQAKQAAIRGVQREASALRSGMVGELATKSMERASQAARDIVTYGGQVRSYEEVTLPTSRQNLEIQRKIFDEFTTPKNALELEKMQNEMGVDNWERVQDMIDRGLGPERVNEEMTKMGMKPLTTDEFASIYQAGELGERNWGRQESAAKMYMTLGQWGAAAEAFSNLYDGVDFDFSKLATQENAQNFNQGISQMASYIAAGIKPDAALKMAQIDSTMELMGVNDEQFLDFYNAARVNALDATWEEVETSKEYQRMLNSTDPAERQEALDMKDLYYAESFGLLDREILHEYRITSPENNPMGSIYAKSPEDAQAKANEYGVGYTVEDTGNISADIKLPPETELEGTGDLAQWETFKESVPPELITPDLQASWQRWVDAGNTGNYDEYRKSTEGMLQSIDVGREKGLLNNENSKTLIDTYKQNPETVKNSGYEYYYDAPTYEEIKGKFTTKTTGRLGTGERKTSVDPKLKASLEGSIGKMTEIPMAGGTVVGQVQDVSVNPKSVTMVIKKLDGNTVTIPIYDSDAGSYRPQPKYYGRK